MSPKRRQQFLRIVGLVTLAMAAYAIFEVIRAIVAKILALNSSIAVAIIAASATALVSVISVVLSKGYEAREQTRKSHREKKIPIYEELIAFMSRVITGAKLGTVPDEQETMKFFTDFTQHIMVWGSDSVIAAWVK